MALYTLSVENKVSKHPFDAVLEFGNLQAVAVVPALNRDLDVIVMEPSLFRGVRTKRVGAQSEREACLAVITVGDAPPPFSFPTVTKTTHTLPLTTC